MSRIRNDALERSSARAPERSSARAFERSNPRALAELEMSELEMSRIRNECSVGILVIAETSLPLMIIGPDHLRRFGIAVSPNFPTMAVAAAVTAVATLVTAVDKIVPAVAMAPTTVATAITAIATAVIAMVENLRVRWIPLLRDAVAW